MACIITIWHSVIKCIFRKQFVMDLIPLCIFGMKPCLWSLLYYCSSLKAVYVVVTSLGTALMGSVLLSDWHHTLAWPATRLHHPG